MILDAGATGAGPVPLEPVRTIQGVTAAGFDGAPNARHAASGVGDGRRRPGDVAASYADATRAEAELGWRATRTVDDMCVDTWRWQSQNPHGYPDA